MLNAATDALNDCGILAETICDYAREQLERVAAACFPGWRLPGVFAGRQVGADVRSDVAFTLGLLHEFGITTAAGRGIHDAISRVLRPLEGRRTNTFWSYRVAETLAHFGPFAGNDLTRGWTADECDNLAAACDSTEFMSRWKPGVVPRNYAAVLARCELARASLGLAPADSPAISALVDAARDLISESPLGYVDDSNSRCGRYDIYTADIYIFTEPFRNLLGPAWQHGARQAVSLVEKTGTTTGAAFPWGRSLGALANCLTIELGALALRDGLCVDPARWLALIGNAFRNIPVWFTDRGFISAHRYRSTYGYRGLHRLLQMTFDCLGKLVWSAIALRDAARHLSVKPATGQVAFPEQDELTWFDEERKAGVWCYRRAGLAFALPLTGSTLNDYLPAPRGPGLFESPVETDLPSGVPFAYRDGMLFTAGSLPQMAEKLPGGLRVHYRDFPQAGKMEVAAEIPRLEGSRDALYRVEGRTLSIEEELRFQSKPAAIALQVTETAGRPLAVEFHCLAPHAVSLIDTAGIKEYRSFWAELPRTHQIDIDPAEEIGFGYSITPLLRVLSSHPRHHYHRTIYDRLANRAVDGVTMPACHRSDMNSYRQWDVFHMHWPEAFGPDPGRHQEMIADLGAAGVPVVWTQHNLVPHGGDERYGEIYQAWALAARSVIHHSEWGREQVLRTYRFREEAIHRIIPHPFFAAGAALAEARPLNNRRLRLGVLGAPRKEKRVDLLIRAFLQCGRDDLELFVYSLAPTDVAPPHPRLHAERYEFVPREIYDARLREMDVLALPFEAGGMLTTGVVGDVFGHGVPALISDWPFLTEVLGDAGIPFGHTEADLVQALRSLDSTAVIKARDACLLRRELYAPELVADRTFALLETSVALGIRTLIE